MNALNILVKTISLYLERFHQHGALIKVHFRTTLYKTGIYEVTQQFLEFNSLPLHDTENLIADISQTNIL